MSDLAIARRAGVSDRAILDATFQRQIHRDAAREVARQAGVPIVFVECRTPVAIIRRRLEERARRNTDASDADWVVYQRQRSNWEPFAPIERAEHVAVDTMADMAEVLREVERRLQ